MSQHFQRLFRKKYFCECCGLMLTRFSDVAILQRQEGIYRKTIFVHKECLNGKEKEKEEEFWKIKAK